MFVYVKRGSRHNRGDELMLRATIRHLRGHGDFQLVGDDKPRTYDKRMQLGLHYTRLHLPSRGKWKKIARYGFLRSCRRSLGYLLDSEIQAVLDITGFGHGDQWGERITVDTARQYARWKRSGSKIVMLPQAFGPFSTPRIRYAFRQMILLADLVYARDRDSYGYAVDISGDRPHIKLAPDITHTFPGVQPSDMQRESRVAFIVPNSKFLTHVSNEVSASYLPFLARLAKGVCTRDIEPVILLHEVKKDYQLINPLRKMIEETSGHPPDVITEEDPERLKGILGSGFVVIGSRFHSLVSSLSQGVPCLGTAWSQKYFRLFEEYGISDYIVSPADGFDDVLHKLDRIISEPTRSDVVEKITGAAAQCCRVVGAMWTEVDRLLATATNSDYTSGAGRKTARRIV